MSTMMTWLFLLLYVFKCERKEVKKQFSVWETASGCGWVRMNHKSKRVLYSRVLRMKKLKVVADSRGHYEHGKICGKNLDINANKCSGIENKLKQQPTQNSN